MSASVEIALLCNQDGVILEFLQDALNISSSMKPGTPFACLAARGSLGKALSFLTEINDQGAAFDWEINLQIGTEIKTLHFTGGRAGENNLVIGTENSALALNVYNELMQINNEQANTLRAIHRSNEQDQALYEQISQLTNELVAMQRELAKKNAQLALANKEMERIMGLLSHDLRVTLNKILNSNKFLLEQCADPEYQKALQAIKASCEFMAQSIENLLDNPKQ